MDRVKFRGFVFTAELDLLGGGFGVDFMLLQSRECMTFVNIIINYKKQKTLSVKKWPRVKLEVRIQIRIYFF